MKTDRLIDRVRAADPSPVTETIDAELFASITAGDGDPRFHRRSRAWWRRGRLPWVGHRLSVTLALLAVGLGGATAAAIKLNVINLELSHATPTALFRADPQAIGNAAWMTQVTPGSVRLASTLTVPGIGRVQYWVAQNGKGWLCQGLRLPGGSWAGLLGNDYEADGLVPGCVPRPTTANHSGEPLVNGFGYTDTHLTAQNGARWRIEYGIVDPPSGHAVEVRDRYSGATAPVFQGHYFAIVLPGSTAQHPCSLEYLACWPRIQLEALDASQHVVTTGPDNRSGGS